MPLQAKYIDKVVFQASFTKIVLSDVLDNNLLATCTEISGVAPTQLKNPVITINSGSAANTTFQIQWVFQGAEYIINLHGEYIQITTNNYNGHDSFYTDIDRVMTIARRVYNLSISKLSIRYINVLHKTEGNPFDFSSLIRPELLNGASFFQEDGIVRSMGTTTVADENTVTNVIYGFFNSQFPNKIALGEFALDIDCGLHIFDPAQTISEQLNVIRLRANSLFKKTLPYDPEGAI